MLFVQFETKKHEQVALNADHIISFTPILRGGSLIMMCDGTDFEVVNSFDDLISMFFHLSILLKS